MDLPPGSLEASDEADLAQKLRDGTLESHGYDIWKRPDGGYLAVPGTEKYTPIEAEGFFQEQVADPTAQQRAPVQPATEGVEDISFADVEGTTEDVADPPLGTMRVATPKEEKRWDRQAARKERKAARGISFADAPGATTTDVPTEELEGISFADAPGATTSNLDPAISAVRGMMGTTGEAAPAPAPAPVVEEDTGEAPALRDLRRAYKGARRSALRVSGEDIQGGAEAEPRQLAEAAKLAKANLMAARDERQERRRMAKGKGLHGERRRGEGLFDETMEVGGEEPEEAAEEGTETTPATPAPLPQDIELQEGAEIETVEPERVKLPQEQAMGQAEQEARIAEIGEAVPVSPDSGEMETGIFDPSRRAAAAALRTGAGVLDTPQTPLPRAAEAVVREGDEVAELLARNSELLGKFGPGDPARASLYDELFPKMLKGDLPTKAQQWLDIEDLAGRVGPEQRAQAANISRAFANTNLDQNERRMLAHYLGQQLQGASPAQVNALIADERFVQKMAEDFRPKYQTWLKNAGSETLAAAGKAVKATVGAPVNFARSIPGRAKAALGEGLEEAAERAFRTGMVKGLNETDAQRAARRALSLKRVGNGLRALAVLGTPGPEDLALVFAYAYMKSWQDVAKMDKSPMARLIWQSKAVADSRFPAKGLPAPGDMPRGTVHPFFTYRGNKLVPTADYTGTVKELAAMGDRDAVMGTILGLINDGIWSEELGAQVMRTVDRETGDIEPGPPVPEEFQEAAEGQQVAAN